MKISLETRQVIPLGSLKNPPKIINSALPVTMEYKSLSLGRMKPACSGSLVHSTVPCVSTCKYIIRSHRTILALYIQITAAAKI